MARASGGACHPSLHRHGIRFSVFWLPLGRAVGVAQGLDKPIPCPGDATTFWGKVAITGHARFAIDCDWTQFDLGWMFTLFFVLLGVSAAIWGGWLERVGPRKAGVVAAICWCGGLLTSAVGVYIHQLWLMWLGSGIIGGVGLGLGYISPVSTLIKWFPDRRGMATGMAIMGFGGGAMIGSPLATLLMGALLASTADIIGVHIAMDIMATAAIMATAPITLIATTATFTVIVTVATITITAVIIVTIIAIGETYQLVADRKLGRVS